MEYALAASVLVHATKALNETPSFETTSRWIDCNHRGCQRVGQAGPTQFLTSRANVRRAAEPTPRPVTIGSVQGRRTYPRGSRKPERLLRTLREKVLYLQLRNHKRPESLFLAAQPCLDVAGPDGVLIKRILLPWMEETVESSGPINLSMSSVQKINRTMPPLRVSEIDHWYVASATSLEGRTNRHCSLGCSALLAEPFAGEGHASSKKAVMYSECPKKTPPSLKTLTFYTAFGDCT